MYFKVDKGVLQCWALGGCQADRLLRVWCNWRRNQSNPPPTQNNESLVVRDYTVKKGSRVSRPQPGCHHQLSMGGNNDVITELFLPRGSLVSVSGIPAGDGKLVNIFIRCITTTMLIVLCFNHSFALFMVHEKSLSILYKNI
jgi:hypothetical protein